MGAQLDELGGAIRNSRVQTEELFEKGREHLSAMRSLVSAPGPVQPRADRYAEEAVTLSGVIAALQETSIAPSVKRAAEDLSVGFIAPVADGLDADLAARQSRVMATIEAAVEAQSQALAQAADQIIAEPRVESRRFQPLSSAEAVIRYASDFAPSWAGAISIDLLPAMLVFMLAIAQNVSMREGAIQADAETMSAADMMRALAVYREMSHGDDKAQIEEMPDKDAPVDQDSERDETATNHSVTPISSIVKK
jgi:hypothetical protein